MSPQSPPNKLCPKCAKKHNDICEICGENIEKERTYVGETHTCCSRCYILLDNMNKYMIKDSIYCSECTLEQMVKQGYVNKI